MWRLRDPRFTFWLVFWIVLIGLFSWGNSQNNKIYKESLVFCKEYANTGANKIPDWEGIKQLNAKKHYVFLCKENKKILLGSGLKVIETNSQVSKLITRYNIDNVNVCKGQRGLKYALVGNFANYYSCRSGRYYYGQVKTLKEICQVLISNEYSEEIEAELREVFPGKGIEYLEKCNDTFL